MLDKLTTEWIVVDGSIFLKEEEKVRMGHNTVTVRQSVAFNIPLTADHIVKLHNESLKCKS